MKVFVTGATGFLGKRLVRHLLQRGDEVSCLVRPGGADSSFIEAVCAGDASARQRLHVVHGTLAQVASCEQVIAECDAVIHGAAAMNGATAVLFLNNVTATRELIRVALRVGTRRFVLVSSLGVFGTSGLKPGDVLDETCPLDAKAHVRDAYSYSKIVQEQVAWEAHRDQGLPLVVVRPSVIYGPGKGCLSARVGLQVGNLMIRMGGSQPVPYTHVDNCAAAVALAASVPNIEGESFNIVDDDLPSAKHVLREYRRNVKRLRVVPVPAWAVGPLSGVSEWYHRYSMGQLPAVLTRYKSAAQWKRLKYSNEKAKRLLKWMPAIGFEQGLRDSCEWLRGQARAAREQGKRTATEAA